MHTPQLTTKQLEIAENGNFYTQIDTKYFDDPNLYQIRLIGYLNGKQIVLAQMISTAPRKLDQ